MTAETTYNRDLAIASLKHLLSGQVNRNQFGTWHSARPTTSTVIRYWDRGEFRYRDYVGYWMDGIHKLFDRSDRSQGMLSTIDPIAVRYARLNGYRADPHNYLPDTIETRYARWYVMHVETFYDVRKMDPDLVGILCQIDDEFNATGFADDVTFGALCDYLEERDIL